MMNKKSTTTVSDEQSEIILNQAFSQIATKLDAIISFSRGNPQQFQGGGVFPLITGTEKKPKLRPVFSQGEVEGSARYIALLDKAKENGLSAMIFVTPEKNNPGDLEYKPSSLTLQVAKFNR